MTALAVGTSVTVSVRDGGTVTIATNGGLGSAVATMTEGGTSSASFGPLPERRVLGPFREGASVVLSNSNCGAFDYDAESTVDPSSPPITVTASRNLALSDLGANLVCNSASAISLNLTVVLPTGFNCAVTQYGAGKVTITAGTGVTIRTSGGLVSTSGQYATIGIMPLGVNEYVLSGSLGA